MTFEEVLARDGRLVYTCKGRSMLPLLRENKDLMIIEKRDSYRKYDVVLFKRPGKAGRGAYVLHRILRINKDGTFWIVGDNCISGETVPRDRILGVMTAVVRDGKTIDMQSWENRIYVGTWCRWYPLRFFLLWTRRLAGRMIHRKNN